MPDQVIGITAREVQTLSGAERGTLLGPVEAAAFECFSAWRYGAEAPERYCALAPCVRRPTPISWWSSPPRRRTPAAWRRYRWWRVGTCWRS